MKNSKIFSGQNSVELWKEINEVNGETEVRNDVWAALYSIGCKCQALERKVDELERSLEYSTPFGGKFDGPL